MPSLGQRTIKTSTLTKKFLNGKKNLSNSRKSRKATHTPPTLLIQRVTSPNLHFARKQLSLLKIIQIQIQEVINEMLLPALFAQVELLPDKLQEVITLSPAQGALGIPSPREEIPQQYAASKAITAPHVRSIIEQSMSSSHQKI